MSARKRIANWFRGKPGGVSPLRRCIELPLLLGLALVFIRCAGTRGGAPAVTAADTLVTPTGALDSGDRRLAERGRTDPVSLLAEALAACENLTEYDGVFVIQERIDGRLREPVESQFRFRALPFSVAMRLLCGNSGVTRLLYVDGDNDGKMIIQPAGILGKIASGVAIDPDGRIARSGSTHAITDFGLAKCLERLLAAYRRDQGEGRLNARCLGVGELEGTTVLTLEKTSRDGITIVDLDTRRLAPLRLRRYDTRGELLGVYQYKSLRFDCRFTDEDFSRQAAGL